MSFIGLCILKIYGYELRVPNKKEEKNKLCLNIWLNENNLSWNKKVRNIYTAHEIAQIIPIINKENTYEKLIWQNKWILKFWPKAIAIANSNLDEKNPISDISFWETIAFKIQYLYMKKKITREVVTPARAVFHPNDWSKIVVENLKRS